MSGIELKILSYIPAIIGVLFVGLFVFLNNTTNVKNRLFSLLNLFIAMWLGFLFIADITTTNSTALWSLRFGLFFGQLTFLMFYLFALEFPFKSKGSKGRLIWSLPIVLLAVSLLTPLGVSTVSIQGYGVQPEDIGLLYAVSDFVGIAYLLAGGLVLKAKYSKSDPQQRSQITFVLIGLSIVVASNIFTGLVVTFLDFDTNYIWLGSVSLFVFSLLVAYVMIRHSFFDIRPVVARSFGYLLLVLSLSCVFAVLVFGATSLFINDNTPEMVTRLVYLIAALVMAFSFQPLRKFFDQISNRLFYRDAYDPQVFLDQFNDAMVANLDVDSLVAKSGTAITENLKPSFVSFYICQTPNSPRHFTDTYGQSGLERGMSTTSKLAAQLKDKVTITDDLIDMKDSRRLYDILRKNNVAMTIVLNDSADLKGQDIGYIFLGYKKSGNTYNRQDTKVLEIAANELVIAIQNAQRFEEIQRFNATLQEKIEDATKRLRQSNAKLKALDQTKDDFISMASHQLRTPLTSVKGYVSMVLDGDVGEITPIQRKLLNQAFISSQRMVYLISDLLNVSRLRTGKFVIEPVSTNLANVIESEVEQLEETSSGRNLKLIYNKPEHFPTLMLDETKIRQVIMNFMDNAIYYTPSGGEITVNLVEKPLSIEFTVIDNGIGVPKHEQHHLFSKFYRANNAKRARPDGTGLGLFMAKKVIVAQGGAIIFRSQEKKGSTFGFTFAKEKLMKESKGDK